MCATMMNAECKQNTCACKDDYFLDSTNSSNCIGSEWSSWSSSRCDIMKAIWREWDKIEARVHVSASRYSCLVKMKRMIAGPVLIGDLCQVNAVCQDSFNSALCINNECQCFTGHHFVNETQTCIQSRGNVNTLYITNKEEWDERKLEQLDSLIKFKK